VAETVSILLVMVVMPERCPEVQVQVQMELAVYARASLGCMLAPVSSLAQTLLQPLVVTFLQNQSIPHMLCFVLIDRLYYPSREVFKVIPERAVM
jgi:hypothetical protein